MVHRCCWVTPVMSNLATVKMRRKSADGAGYLDTDDDSTLATDCMAGMRSWREPLQSSDSVLHTFHLTTPPTPALP